MLENIGVERALISSICQYGKEALIEIEDIGVSTESFTNNSNQALFVTLKYILDNKEHVDQALLLISLKELGYDPLFNNRKDIEYIGSLFSFPISVNNVRNFAIRLEKLHVARLAIEKHRQSIESLELLTGQESMDEIISKSEDPVFDLIIDLNKSKDNGPQLLFDDIDDVIQDLKDNPCENIGIPTPWPTYNAAIGGGLRRGGVNLISARPKIGKSTIGKEALLHFSNTLKIPCMYLDTEMSKKDQQIRSVASKSKVYLNDIETGKFGDNYLYNDRVLNTTRELKNNKLLWYQSIASKPFEEVLSIIRRWVIKEVGFGEDGRVNDCVVVYDYFKLMDKADLKDLREYEALGYQISKLTDFCKEFDFPCLAFVQLNRQNEISQSDRLIWLCNSFSKFEKKSSQEIMDDTKKGGNRKLTVCETRFGGGIEDGDYICFNFQRSINHIIEIGLKSKLNEIPESTEDEFEIDNSIQTEEEDETV